jgi:hypothetical protein
VAFPGRDERGRDDFQRRREAAANGTAYAEFIP